MAFTSVGNLEVVLGANMAAFVKGMTQAAKTIDDTEKRGNTFGAKMSAALSRVGAAATSLKAAVGIGLAGLVSYRTISSLNEASQTVDELGKASKRLGVGVQELADLRFAAGEAGVEFETLAKAVGKLQKNIGEVLVGGGNTLTVGRFAIALRDTNGQVRPLTTLLPQVAKALESVGSEAERANLAQGLFGREGGDKFLALLHEGGTFMENLAEQTRRLHRLGGILTQEQVDRLTAYNDAVGRIGEAFFWLRVQIMSHLAPALTEIANRTALLTGALPTILKGITGGDLGADMRIKLANATSNLLNEVVELWRFAGRTSGAVFAAALRDGIISGVPLVWGALETMTREVLISWGKYIANAMDFVGDMPFGQMFDGYSTAILEGVAQLKDDAKAEMDDLVNGMFDPETGANGALVRVFKRTGDELALHMKTLGGAADGLISLADAMRGTEEAAPGAAAGITSVADAAGDLTRQAKGVATPTFYDGMIAGFAKLKSEAADVVGLGQKTIVGFTEGLTGGLADALVESSGNIDTFSKNASKAFEDLAKGVLKAIIQFSILRTVTSSMNALWGYFDPSATGGRPMTPYDVGPPRQDGSFAAGGAFEHGRVVARPTLFPMANGMGLMGEAGPEAVMPLARVGGKLGVKSAGGGTTVNIIDQRQGGEPVQAKRSRGPDGRDIIEITVRDTVNRMFGDGSFDRAVGANFGLGRRPTPR